MGIGPYKSFANSVRNSELLQVTREKSRKTEGVFLVGSRRSGGKSKSLRASNCKPAKRLQFEEEESDSEDKRLRKQRGLVPARPVLTSQHFLLEKQKKMLYGSCKFLRGVFTLRIRRRTFTSRSCLLQRLRRCTPASLTLLAPFRGALGRSGAVEACQNIWGWQTLHDCGIMTARGDERVFCIRRG